MTGKPHIEQAVSWLRARGAENVRVEHDSKHPKIFYTWLGIERFYVTSWTPRNVDDCTRNAIRDLRHEMGLVGGKRVGKRRQHRDRAAAVPIQLPRITLGVCWHSALVQHPTARASLSIRLDAAWRMWWREFTAQSGWVSRL